MDKWVLNKLNEAVDISTQNFDNYEYSKAKATTDLFFWKDFCDNYLEISKDRLYNGNEKEKKSAQYTLYVCLLKILKLFAPIMPFVTEEIYQSIFKDKEKAESIHITEWPKYEKTDKKIIELGDKFVDVLSYVRQEKAKSGRSLKDPVKLLICGSELKSTERDLKAVTKAENINYGKNLFIEF